MISAVISFKTVMHEIILPPDETAKSLENYLKKQFPIGYVRKVFRKNGVRINGQRAKADSFIRAGDRVQLYIPFVAGMERQKAAASAQRLDIIYEDKGLLVINKPAGLAVHESKTDRKKGSVIGILESQYRDAGVRPQLVHRLDKDTSGLLLVAKNLKNTADLQDAFETRKVNKRYLCLVVGRLSTNEGKIDLPLPGRDGNLVRALTRYQVVERFSEATLLRVTIETGRLHQIRLHFAHLGHPVVMDDQHGDFVFNKRFRKQHRLKRQFLHAETLTLSCEGKRNEWTAPVPDDLERTLKSLSKEML